MQILPAFLCLLHLIDVGVFSILQVLFIEKLVDFMKIQSGVFHDQMFIEGLNVIRLPFALDRIEGQL